MSIECKWCGMELTDEEIGEQLNVCKNCTESEMEVKDDFIMTEEEANG